MDFIEISFLVIIVILIVLILSFVSLLINYHLKINPKTPRTKDTTLEYFYKLQPDVTKTIENRVLNIDNFIKNIQSFDNYKLFKILSGIESF